MKSAIAVPIGEGGQDGRKAAIAVIDRLLQMRQLWEDAANSYFDPSRFQPSIQNCITTARTVTFIVQSNKKALANFDAWYEPHQKRCADDPMMVWARDTRNSIEKQGDLATHSQVHVELVASYLDGPQSAWVPANLFTTTNEIWKSVPADLRTPHTIESGTLIVERRWVANNYPEVELLEAVAHAHRGLHKLSMDAGCSTIFAKHSEFVKYIIAAVVLYANMMFQIDFAAVAGAKGPKSLLAIGLPPKSICFATTR